MQSELRFKNHIDETDDETDDEPRRIPDATRLAKIGIVRGKEVFVEMQNRIRLLGRLAVVLHNLAEIGRGKERNEIIHYPFNGVVRICGDVVEHLTEERIRLRN